MLAYNIYITYHRLQHAPRLSPPLHQRLHTHDGDEKIAISYDLIPCNAHSPSVLMALLMGQCVPAQVRVRRVKWPVRTVRSCPRGQGFASNKRVHAWISRYRGCDSGRKDVSQPQISLYSSNCYTFVQRLERFMRTEE